VENRDDLNVSQGPDRVIVDLFDDHARAISAHDHVARSLAMDILSGVIPIGENLPHEDALLERFQVSRTVLREGLKTLAAKGLIVSKTRVGTRVRPEARWNFFDPDLLSWKLQLGYDEKLRDDLSEIRCAIEPQAAALAAQRRTADDLVALRHWIGRMREPGHTARSFAEADLGLHLSVSAASGNAMMRSIGAIIEAALMASFTLNSAVEEEEVLAESIDRHEAIVDAIEKGDSDGAAAAMLLVIDQGTSRIRASMSEAAPRTRRKRTKT
jgi:DNA-binding FadR family transcriptional regulator